MPWFTGSFTADIVMTDSQQPSRGARGKLYVGPQRFRAEGSHDGTRKIVLFDAAQHQAWTILPDQRQYHKGMLGPMPPAPDVDILPDDRNSPCTASPAPAVPAPQVTCRKLGQEVINGVTVDKWIIDSVGHPGRQEPQDRGGSVTRQTRMTMWVDPVRKLIIRQQADEEGPVMERRLLDTESLAGRETERWEFSHTTPGARETKRYTEWVDSRLRLPVRTAGQQRFTLEITGLQEGTQPDALFRLPDGFQETTPPQPPAGGQR
jgi:hypothetical protein